MRRSVVIILIVVMIMMLPATGLLGITVLIGGNPSGTCGSGTVDVSHTPGSLTATTRSGVTLTLGKIQLTRAATIITVGDQIPGVGRAGVLVALMAALTESSLRQLANPGAYPASTSYPNDGNGSDHDSLGLFQMRPSTGWGSVAQLMGPTYQARAFFGGPTGPNSPFPRGLLDIPGWSHYDPGVAAQAVEVSAYPDRYQDYQPVAEAILDALTQPDSDGPSPSSPTSPTAPTTPGSHRVVFPLPKGTWTESSPFGWRTDPFTGASSFHTGIDYAAPLGTPVLAIADGIVTFAGSDQIYGGLVIITHQIGGRPVATAYGHMPPGQIHAHTGQQLAAGQQIGQVGSEGRSTGPHLHIEVRPGGPDATAVDPGTWLSAHHADDLDQPTTGISGACPGSEDQFPCISIRTLAPSTAPANSATSSEPCS